MEITHTLLFFLGFLLIALVLKPLSEKIRFPYPALLVVAGFLLAELLIAQGIDTGLRWDSFHDLVFYVLLPILIYETAFRLNAEQFFKNVVTILILAVPLMFVATIITAVLIYYGINHPVGFPFIAALITAAILSANDPSAVIAVMKATKLPDRFIAILEGEGLFSGAMAIVLVSLFSVMAVENVTTLEFLPMLIKFATVFSGGILVGMIIGLLVWIMLYFIKAPVLRGILSLISAYAGFLIAQDYLQVSGVIAVLVTGLIVNAFTQKADTETRNFLQSLWQYKSTIATALVFLLLGVSIQLSVLANQWLAILMGIGAALAARFVIVVIGLNSLTVLPGIQRESISYQLTIVWGGLSGAVSIALVLSLPELPYFQTIQGIVYGVVLFSLFVQAPTLRFLNR
jgi:CPA1 family monovalent cation:H+ antiporter